MATAATKGMLPGDVPAAGGRGCVAAEFLRYARAYPGAGRPADAVCRGRYGRIAWRSRDPARFVPPRLPEPHRRRMTALGSRQPGRRRRQAYALAPSPLLKALDAKSAVFGPDASVDAEAWKRSRSAPRPRLSDAASRPKVRYPFRLAWRHRRCCGGSAGGDRYRAGTRLCASCPRPVSCR